MAQHRPHTTARTAVVWAALCAALDGRSAGRGADRGLHILDAGGGSGGFAVPLAQLGHDVTVVDPSPDSLASLERRAAEAGVVGLRGVQGSLDDAAALGAVVAPARFDVVLCHHVLEVVDDPAAAVAALVEVLRPGGVASVLAANRVGAVLGRVLGGRLDEAERVLTDPDGHGGPGDALVRRFDRSGLVGLLTAAGLRVDAVHGARVFTDLVPGGLVDADPAAHDALLRLETYAAERAEFVGIAAALHVLATKSG